MAIGKASYDISYARNKQGYLDCTLANLDLSEQQLLQLTKDWLLYIHGLLMP